MNSDLLKFEATAPLRKKRVLNIDDFLIGFFCGYSTAIFILTFLV